MMKTYPQLREISHKFLLLGHTRKEVNGPHSLIGRAKWFVSGHTIFTCNNWANFLISFKQKSCCEEDELRGFVQLHVYRDRQNIFYRCEKAHH